MALIGQHSEHDEIVGNCLRRTESSPSVLCLTLSLVLLIVGIFFRIHFMGNSEVRKVVLGCSGLSTNLLITSSLLDCRIVAEQRWKGCD